MRTALSVVRPPAARAPSKAPRKRGFVYAMAGLAGRWRSPFAGEPTARASGRTSYTDLVIDQIQAQAMGRGGAGRPAAVEVAARLVGRALMAADVANAPPLTPSVMQVIGRQLVVRGESLHAYYEPDELLSAATWDVNGGPVRSSWVYRVDLLGPSGQYSNEEIGSDGVLHVVIDPPPDQPWRGSTPAQSEIAKLAAVAASASDAEFQVPPTRILPLPDGLSTDQAKGLQDDLKAKAGKVAMPSTTRAGAGDGLPGAPPPSSDWNPKRVGPDHSAGQVQAHSDAESRLAASLGVHPSLLSADATAGAMREARRQIQIDLLDPYARAVEEAARRIWPRARVRFPPRTDVVLLMARAAETLTRIGVRCPDAMRIAGFDPVPACSPPKPEPGPTE